VHQILTRRGILRAAAGTAGGLAGAALLAACGGAAATLSTTAASLSASATGAVTTSAVPTSAVATTSAAPTTTAATSAAATSTTASSAAATSASPSLAASTSAATSSQAAAASSSVAATTSRPAAAPGQLRYTTQNVSKPFSDIEGKVVQEFQQQNPNVKVSYELFPNQDLQQKLTVLAAAGTSSDCADIETKWMPGFYASGMLLDLTSYAARAKITADTYFPQEWNKAHIGGKLLIMPLDLQPIVIFYNKDVFNAHGVPLPPAKWDDPSWTWDELVARAQKLTTTNGADKTFGVSWPLDWRESLETIWGNGGSVLNADHTQSTITMASTTDGFQYHADLINKYHVHPNADEAKALGDTLVAFINGKLGMWANNVTEAFYIAAKKQDVNYDIAPMPTGKAGSFTRNPADSVMVAAGTKSPDQAFALASYVTGPAGQSELVAKAGLGVPPYRAVAESADFLKPQVPGAEGRNFQMVLDMLENNHYKYAPVTTIYPQMVKLFTPVYAQVLQGKISAAQFAQQVDGPLNELLKQVPEVARGFLGD
jgi:multiple sugar transport system substrate-binding protein